MSEGKDAPIPHAASMYSPLRMIRFPSKKTVDPGPLAVLLEKVRRLAIEKPYMTACFEELIDNCLDEYELLRRGEAGCFKHSLDNQRGV